MVDEVKVDVGYAQLNSRIVSHRVVEGLRLTFVKLFLMEVFISSPSTPEYFVVMKISLRSRPLSRMAMPASASFLYD